MSEISKFNQNLLIKKIDNETRNIQIINNNLGKPYYLISSKIKNLIKKKKKSKKF